MSMIFRSTNLIRKTLFPSSFTVFTKSISSQRSIPNTKAIDELWRITQQMIDFKNSYDPNNTKPIITDLSPRLQERIKLICAMNLMLKKDRCLVDDPPVNVDYEKKKYRRILLDDDDTYKTSKLISDLPPNLQQVIKLFSDMNTYRLFEKKLLPYYSDIGSAAYTAYYSDIGSAAYTVPIAKSRVLLPLSDIYKTSDNKVEEEGCTSQIWVRAYIDSEDPDNKVWFEAAFDCKLVWAMAGLLFQNLSGRPLAELTPDFFALFQQSVTLTPSKFLHEGKKDFLCMLKHMQKKCLLLAAANCTTVKEYQAGDGDGDGLQEVIKLFSDIQQNTELFEKKLLPYYNNVRMVPPLHRLDMTTNNKVSTGFWVRTYIDCYDDPEYEVCDDPHSKVWFEAHIGCAITRAMAGLLFQSLAGRPLSELTPDFFTRFQESVTATLTPDSVTLFQQSVTPTELYKGFFSMLNLMQKQCILLADSCKEEAAFRSELIKRKLESELSPV